MEEPKRWRQSGYSIGYDPVSKNSTKPTAYSKKKPSGDYPKIEGEFKEEEYGQVPLRASIIECGVKYHNDVEAKLREREFKNFLGFGHKEKGLFWFRFKHNNKGFHVKNTKIHPLLFSERINKTGFSIGNWHFKWLKKYEG